MTFNCAPRVWDPAIQLTLSGRLYLSFRLGLLLAHGPSDSIMETSDPTAISSTGRLRGSATLAQAAAD